MGQAKFMIGLVMVAAFTIAILAYSIGFANDNNAAVSLSDDSEFSQLQTNLEDTSDEDYLDYNSSEGTFRSKITKSGDENFEIGGGITDVGTTPRKSLNYILGTVRSKIFGNDAKFGRILNMFMGVIILLGIFYAWKTIKGGNPD